MTPATTTPWQLLIIALSSQHATPRMRVWRALKASGAAALRDGVYLLPYNAAGDQLLRSQAEFVRAQGGNAHLLRFALDDGAQQQELQKLFDRSAGYGELQEALRAAQRSPRRQADAVLQRLLSALRRRYAALVAIDYFPNAAQAQTRAALSELEQSFRQRLAPGEPRSANRPVARLAIAAHQRRTWATRRGLWVDRAASAWLIKRFIDTKARFIWLDDTARCPPKALGFDFDGATFTHVDARVTFEVLLASFDLKSDAALVRLGTLVHFLDIGGVQVAEAAGFEAIMTGARAAHGDDDDALLHAITPTLDCLYAGFKETLPRAQ